MIKELEAVALAVPTWNWGLQGLGVITGYIGAEMNARMRIEGFFLRLVSNVALGVLHALTGLWLLLVLDILFFRVNIRPRIPLPSGLTFSSAIRHAT